MKRYTSFLFSLISITMLFGQNKMDYIQSWKSIDDLMNQQQLPETAAKEVDQLYKKAFLEKNYPQVVKALSYQINLKTRNNNQDHNIKMELINEIKRNISTLPFPANALVQSQLAQVYLDHYNRYIWQYANRTKTDKASDDINTWDLQTINKEIISAFKLSLNRSDELKMIPTSTYSDCLEGDKDNLFYRPTLYDLLAGRAVEAFSTSRMEFKNQNVFEINNPDLFVDSKTFIQLNLGQIDQSLNYQTALFFQNWLKFRLQDQNITALIDADLNRLNFMYQISNLINKDALYENALIILSKQFPKESVNGDVLYQLAYFYAQQNQNAAKLKKAVQLCEQIIKQYPKSTAASNKEYAQNLLKNISSPKLSLTTEQIYLPNKPIKVAVLFTNISRVNFSIYKVPINDLRGWLDFDEEKMNLFCLNNKPISIKTEVLPFKNDFIGRTTELALDALPEGVYVVQIAHEGSKQNSLIQVSSLGVSHTDGIASVYNRQTGKRVPFANIGLLERKFGPSDEVKMHQIQCSKEGQVDLNKKQINRIALCASVGKSIVYMRDYGGYLPDYHRTDPKTYQQLFFFTDRSIYRPGQTVYFKAIYLSKTANVSSVISKQNVSVLLIDGNNKEISRQSFTTNEFGSINGSFTIPSGLLNGGMQLKIAESLTESGSIYFRVEEYKRPTFEVKFDELKEEVPLNSNVNISLQATALAGYAIDGAKVQYRIIRESKSRYPYFWWRSVEPEPARELASGIGTTNDVGKFSINFTCLADDVKNDEWVYTYTITADITDINGETHSGTYTVKASLKPLVIECNLTDFIDYKNGIPVARVKTLNLNGTPVKANVQVSIDQLEVPKGLVRNRLMAKPDTSNMSKIVYSKLFPYDLYYTDEYNPSQFAVKKQISKINCIDSFSLSKDMPSGWYRISLTATTEKGVNAVLVQYAQVVNGTPIPIVQIDDWFKPIKTSAKVGEQAEFYLAGSNQSVIYYTLYRKTGAKLEIIEQRNIPVGPVPSKFTIDIKDKYLGGVTAYFEMVHENRLYQNQVALDVPYENKQLNISFKTFRDKLMPGQNEKWQLSIKDQNDQPQQVEFLACLYDAFLDAIAPHQWGNLFANSHPIFHTFIHNQANNFNQVSSTWAVSDSELVLNLSRVYPTLSILDLDEYSYAIRGIALARGNLKMSMPASKFAAQSADQVQVQEVMAESGQSNDELEQKNDTPPFIETRKNFSETAFFYPELRTNDQGETLIEFTIPESLTRWKFLGLAHTKDLKIGTIEQQLITQKEIAISANAPRFFREGDTIVFTAKVNNLTDAVLSGTAYLNLADASNMQSVNQICQSKLSQSFKVAPLQSTVVRWTLIIPVGVPALTYKVTAESDKHTDGEEKTIPVLSNNKLVTESMPFMVRSGQTKAFTFSRLKNVQSNSLRNHSLTLEFTSNPAWYAVQALPYLMENPYECTEQTFARYFANALSLSVTESSPKVKQIFDLWRMLPDSKALTSNLEKNEELKQALLEETPWVMEANSETERKKRIALLFDLNKMAAEQSRSFNKLKQAQINGSFGWFEGLTPNRYITQHIIIGLAQLQHLKAINSNQAEEVNSVVQAGLAYLDQEIANDYNKLINDKANLNESQISAIQLHYLYACSYYQHKPADTKQVQAFEYYLGQAERFWNKQSLYNQALSSLILNRFNKVNTAQSIVKSLKERAKKTEELGMYWADNQSGYFWYQAPIETQALLIEVFHEVTNDVNAVEELKLWLIRNKQTNDWKTTKATSLACYALLMTGDNLISDTKTLNVKVGQTELSTHANSSQLASPYVIHPEPGTGYVKTSWLGSDVQTSMAHLEVKNPNKSAAWGAMYWQYFEQLEKITSSETKLRMNRSLFVKTNTASGPLLTPIEKTELKVGDLITVRMELRADRDYEYVHLKDGRAAGFEPQDNISGYQYQDGLHYYQSIKDASTNFFFDFLPKGIYVFEYNLRVTHEGQFSSGISTFQCMYAPEFNAHSNGIRINVK